MNRTSKKLWACWINGGGPIFAKPRRCTLADNGWYWDTSGDYSVGGIGFQQESGWCSFASESKSDVQLFLDGALAFKDQLIESLGAIQ